MIYSTSLICCDQADVRADVELLVNAGFTDFHADFMDGQFVPRLGICPEVLKDLRKHFNDKITIGSHLMLQNPERFVDKIAPYSDTIWVHREITNPLRTVDYINRNYPNVKVGLAYNPETDFREVFHFDQVGVKSVLLMGINPGVLDSSKYISLLYNKVGTLDKSWSIEIYVDGGVYFNTIPFLKRHCEGVVCGSSTIFKDLSEENTKEDILRNCEELKKL